MKMPRVDTPPLHWMAPSFGATELLPDGLDWARVEHWKGDPLRIYLLHQASFCMEPTIPLCCMCRAL